MGNDSRDILALCYDSLSVIDDNKFIVSLDGKYGIVDSNNNILLDMQQNRIEKLGNIVFVGNNHTSAILDTDTFKLSETYYTDLKECGKSVIVRQVYGDYGVLGSNGEYIMPPIYRNIKINKQHLNYTDLWVNYNGSRFITQISNDGTRVSRFDLIETEQENVHIVATAFRKEIKANSWIRDVDVFKLSYELFYNMNQVTNGEYSGIMYKRAYVPFNLVHTFKDGYVGIVSTTGNEIIPCDRYKRIESVGYNGIYLVEDTKNKWGIYKEGRGTIVENCFDSIVTRPTGVPITYLHRQVNNENDWWIVGNTGNVYRECIQAFPLYKLNVIGIEAYKVNVYGIEYVVDAQFNNIKIDNYSSEYWKRVN